MCVCVCSRAVSGAVEAQADQFELQLGPDGHRRGRGREKPTKTDSYLNRFKTIHPCDAQRRAPGPFFTQEHPRPKYETIVLQKRQRKQKKKKHQKKTAVRASEQMKASLCILHLSSGVLAPGSCGRTNQQPAF